MKRRDQRYRPVLPFRPVAQPISYWWRFKTTPAGKWAVAALVVCAMVGARSLQVPVFQVFCVMLAILLVTWLAGRMFRPALAVAGRLPDRVSAGQSFACRFTLTNVSRRRTYDVSMDFFRLPSALRAAAPKALIPQIDPRQSATVSIDIAPLRRGIHPLPRPCVFTTFPLNLLRTGGLTDAADATVLALPTFHPLLDIDVPMGRRHQPGGIALTSNIGESPEYIGNREYRPGDPMRRIDHRSWGRIGKPVVREYQEEYYCRVALILDTYIPAPLRRIRRWAGGRDAGIPPAGYPALEAAISLSAAVADALSRGEYLIDIFAAGPELYVFRAGRHTAHFENILEILACLDACHSNPFDTLAPALVDELENISSAICVFLGWDESRRRLARRIVEAGCSLKVVIIGDESRIDRQDEGLAEGGFSIFTPDDVRDGKIEIL